jgi:uncharacterized protein
MPGVRAGAGRLRRQIYRRLLVPLLRGRHPPEYAARGVFVGVFIALTPTTGIQMLMVGVVWLVVRRWWPEREFSLVAGLAWTWITNVFTLPPLYFLYLLTGRALLGHPAEVHDYETFEDRLAEPVPEEPPWIEVLPDESGSLQMLWTYSVNLLDRFALPIFVGSLPWTLLGAWLGYHGSLALVRRVRASRLARRVLRQAQTREE